MKAAILALAIRIDDGKPTLLDAFSDSHEIRLLESSLSAGVDDPLKSIYDRRVEQTLEDEKFSDYVEELLSSPFVKPEIQEHGVQWLKSKIRIEEFQRKETEAAKIIAKFAFNVFCDDPSRLEMTLAGPSAQVKVKVVVVGSPSVNHHAA
ncbi:MAG: hypothetical protein P4M08_14720 [Oligoflexia bacterium]|nr:hypothetical protein [Oligoflexia bacterium]